MTEAAYELYADSLQKAREKVDRLRKPWRAVDDQDWDYILNDVLGHGGRDKFWRAVLTEMREAFTSTLGTK